MECFLPVFVFIFNQRKLIRMPKYNKISSTKIALLINVTASKACPKKVFYFHYTLLRNIIWSSNSSLGTFPYFSVNKIGK